MALGAILAATDSVAALQVISQDRHPLLYSLVFGEGVINDATSIVILGTIQKFGLESASELSFRLGVVMLLDFSYLFVASTILGMAFGLVTAYCLRAFHFHHVAQAGWGACRVSAAGLLLASPWGLRAPHRCFSYCWSTSCQC